MLEIQALNPGSVKNVEGSGAAGKESRVLRDSYGSPWSIKLKDSSSDSVLRKDPVPGSDVGG